MCHFICILQVFWKKWHPQKSVCRTVWSDGLAKLLSRQAEIIVAIIVARARNYCRHYCRQGPKIIVVIIVVGASNYCRHYCRQGLKLLSSLLSSEPHIIVVIIVV